MNHYPVGTHFNKEQEPGPHARRSRHFHTLVNQQTKLALVYSVWSLTWYTLEIGLGIVKATWQSMTFDWADR